MTPKTEYQKINEKDNPKYVEVTTTKRIIKCKYCKSENIRKHGKLKEIQYYLCKDCKQSFSGVDTYINMQKPKELVIKSLTYYYNGMSYRNITNTFNDLLDYNFPKSTIWRWLMKYSKMANKYVLTLHPKLSDTWIADETAVFIFGKQYWYWDIIDTKTRFLIATHLSKTRTLQDAKKFFYMAKLRSKTRPKVIRTDKLQGYHTAFNKVFFSNIKERRVTHLTSEGFNSPTNINMIERFHGNIKQRTKVMRHLKKLSSARITLDGYITHYNFFLEHDYLNGRTPAIAGGIGKGITNWGDLIELAYQTPIKNPEVRLEWEEEFMVE